jgi:hypothetical protein
VESTEPKQVYNGKSGFVSERIIKDIIIIMVRRGQVKSHEGDEGIDIGD